MRTKHLWSLGLAGLSAAALGAAAPATDAGTITGTVTFTGTPPKMRPIDMAKEPSCAKQHETPVLTETVVSGPNSTLANVVVYITAGDTPGPAPKTVVHYQQKGCEYIPHIAVFQAGQHLEIANSDQTSHNIHPLAKTNAEWNKSQPPWAPPIEATYDKPEFIAVKCNVHPWMHGYFAVLATSRFALSGLDGSYSIPDLPPGKYTVTAWHERMGTQSQEVTVGAGATTANFVFKALPY